MNVFESRLMLNARIVHEALDEMLPKADHPPTRLHEAMRYSIFSGGKRLRPTMVIESARLFGASHERVIPIACGVEMIHTYSLIHDDLPSMDDDDLRRGVPTNHKVFGDAMAILAGDALLTEAFGCISKNSQMEGVSAIAVIEVIEMLSKACGSLGMVGGQSIDLLSVDQKSDLETLNYISEHKTGDLICASLWAGARIAGASQKDLTTIAEYGRKVGLLFQIVDDLLDLEGDEAVLGKPVRSDLRNQKNTFPQVLGFERARELAEQISEDAKKTISAIENVEFFVKMADFILMRQN